MTTSARATEQAKLKAAYWNGLALATAATGFVPLALLLMATTEVELQAPSWEEALVKASAAFAAFALSRVFHAIGLRALKDLDRA